jgi:hypothetical protein
MRQGIGNTSPTIWITIHIRIKGDKGTDDFVKETQ